MIDFGGCLQAAKQGDEDAFARIWRELNPGLLRYLRVTATRDAEDLAADTWSRVVRLLDSFEGDEDRFRAWLYTSARNRLIDWYRARARRPEVIDHERMLGLAESATVEGEVEERSATDAAVELIASLPPDQAEAVMLRTVAGLSVADVARVMKRSPGAVRVLCHRGLRRLEKLLDSDHDRDDADARHGELALATAAARPGRHVGGASAWLRSPRPCAC